jgi:hypothetical protein
MPDSLYLSLWFRGFESEDLLPRAVAVMRDFPFSAARPGITYVALHPVSWNEATILERRFMPGIAAEEAAEIAADLLHEDFAYVFEAAWDLWGLPESGGAWVLQPAVVRFMVRGSEFEEGEAEQEGHIQVDFGADNVFLHEEVRLTGDVESRVRANVRKLVEFTNAVERDSGATARLLWSESEENLAQKLIARLQRVQ